MLAEGGEEGADVGVEIEEAVFDELEDGDRGHEFGHGGDCADC